MKKISGFLIFVLLFLSACQKKSDSPTYNKGNLTILTDPAFESVTTALADGYMLNYPDTKLKVETKKEDLAFLDLLNYKTTAIVMSRNLNREEENEFKKQIDMDPQPAKFAADAVVFVVPKSSARTNVSFEEIIKLLSEDSKNIIFSGTNSSDLNFVAQTLGKKPSQLKFSIISGTENLISELNKYPDKIGAVGLNKISRPYGTEAEKLRNLIKILPVTKADQSYSPDFENLREMKYPFTRILYFLTNEGNFSIANGFIRFSCTQLGQMIVQKEGLQKYNLYQREVQMR